ncbi:hypothetical protein CS369_02835, partial [Candidatus Symbiopectobacterium sp. 'North America']|nr:hypothetical protein [Candidatus Symbiopectobacterium sp. 'North America']
QIAQVGLSSLQVIYYYAKLFRCLQITRYKCMHQDAGIKICLTISLKTFFSKMNRVFNHLSLNHM